MKKTLIIVLLLTSIVAYAANENLDEMIDVRISRQAAAQQGKDYFEDSGNNYIWQPETLAYIDVAYGTEVWRMTGSVDTTSVFWDISWPNVSADGKRLAVNTDRPTDSHSCSYGNWMVMRSDGTYFRSIDNSACFASTSSGRKYWHWSPTEPDDAYQFASESGACTAIGSPNNYDLYKVTFTDTSESTALWLTFPDTSAVYSLKKAISPDGVKIIPRSSGKWYPATVAPSGSKALDDADGYTMDMDWDSADYWGDTESADGTMHDQFLVGNATEGYWNHIMPEATHGTWYRARLTGSGADGEPQHTEDTTCPYSWGDEIEPTNTVTQQNDDNDPNENGSGCGYEGVDYFSHYVPGVHGRYVAHTKSNTAPSGNAVYDLDGHDYEAVKTSTGGAQHHDFHAFSDWMASSAGDGYANHKIWRMKYNDDTTGEAIASAHIEGPGSATLGLARPSQSPDGTKTYFHTTFLNQSDDDYPDLFYVVAYYPYPPEVESVEATGGTVTATVYWDLDGNNRGYTTRGWPEEGVSDPPPPREIEKFRLWRSADKSTWTAVDTSDYDIWDLYDFSDGTWESGDEDTAGNKWTLTDTPGDGTWYYAVTSQEWSGLESHALSNIFSITVASGSGSGSEDTSYPVSPGGDSNFYSTTPGQPQNLGAAHSGSGRYTVTFEEPASPGYVRYYNLYAYDSQAPTAVQARRIASIPATQDEADGSDDGAFSFIDSFGHIGGYTSYGITSVDFQGNESAILTTGGEGENTGIQGMTLH